MATKGSLLPQFRIKSGHAAIVIVIHQAGGLLYLDPKPGGERVKQGRRLAIVAVNLTAKQRRVDVDFKAPISGSLKRSKWTLTVEPWKADQTVITVSKSFFSRLQTVADAANVVVVPYEVIVGTNSVDPELEIER